jgi:hypothetical protein
MHSSENCQHLAAKIFPAPSVLGCGHLLTGDRIIVLLQENRRTV